MTAVESEHDTGGDTHRLGLSQSERDVCERIIAPAQPQTKRGMLIHEGYRFFTFGETGSGKTSLQRVVLYYTLAKGWSDYALIHDAKGILPEYPQSVMFIDTEAFRRRGFVDGDIPVASFRGNPRLDVAVSAEDVAYVSKYLAQRGQVDASGVWSVQPHLLVIEELSAAASEGRKTIRAPSVVWHLEQGRKVGTSLIGTTQSPRKCPPDIIQQASSVAFFRLTGHDANYLGEVLDLDPALIAALRGANNEGLPNFQFALYVKGEPWDGQIYSLDKKTALMFE